MKKLTKVMLSVAAVFAMTAAMAVTAMADDTITGTYNNESGLVTMEGVIGSGKSQTILVLDNNVAEGEEPGIAYINQIDNDGKFSTFYLAAGLQSSAPVTYSIKIGGTDKSLQTGTLTISATVPATVTIVLGDVTGDSVITSRDIQRIGRYITNDYIADKGTGDAGQTKTKISGDGVVIGDVTGDGVITSRDIQRIGRYITNDYIADKGTGDAGVEIEVLDNASSAE